MLCIASLPIIRSKATEEERAEAYRLKGGYAIPVVALLLCLWLGAQAQLLSWQVTGGLLAVGLVLYALAGKRRARARAD